MLPTILSPLHTHRRQIHLDFHTSPLIPDVARDFDAQAFAQQMAEAHVNSVTVFAKCHHGMCYYPTKRGTQHPALNGRDLLGEQIEALLSKGIRAPIYTTIVWEEDVATRFPQWRQLRRDGIFAGTSSATDNSGAHPGAWKWNNFVHPDYQDYIEAHLREILENYPVDGLFLDILMMHPDACWSAPSLQFRARHNLLGDDRETKVRFESLAQHDFCAKFSRIIHGLQPQATIFYNSNTFSSVDSSVGQRTRTDFQTHFEIESLPSGFWGYGHFPRMVRRIGRWNKPWLGMTGRFQRQWGDFGGIKPQPALEFECFQAQAHGGAMSIGDQLPPRGILDSAAYDLISAVYKQVEEAEPFYEGSTEMPHIGALSPSFPGRFPDSEKSEEGVVTMCEEAGYDSTILDDASDLSPFELLILPDSTVITQALKSKLSKYLQAGGKLLISHHAGRDAGGSWALDFLPLRFEGEGEKFPTYWRADRDFWPEASKSDRVFYAQGTNVVADEKAGVQVLVERVLPYFQRTDAHFSSHFQTPPTRDADRFPAVVAGERWAYFADPIFREYRQTGNLIARDGWKKVMQRLVGEAPFGSGLPTTVRCLARRRGNDLILTLLHYVPVRKALDIDVIEERMSFAGLSLRLPQAARSVRIWNGADLERGEDGAWILPLASGRLLLESPRFFE